jgi:hypothetical protein
MGDSGIDDGWRWLRRWVTPLAAMGGSGIDDEWTILRRGSRRTTAPCRVIRLALDAKPDFA